MIFNIILYTFAIVGIIPFVCGSLIIIGKIFDKEEIKKPPEFEDKEVDLEEIEVDLEIRKEKTNQLVIIKQIIKGYTQHKKRGEYSQFYLSATALLNNLMTTGMGKFNLYKSEITDEGVIGTVLSYKITSKKPLLETISVIKKEKENE